MHRDPATASFTVWISNYCSQKQKKAGFKVDSYAKVKKLADEKREQIEAEKLRQQQVRIMMVNFRFHLVCVYRGYHYCTFEMKEREKRAKEKEEAKVAAAEKRKKRQKLFSKKTYKGQPYLHNQMSFLLEKIEANIANEARSSTS